MYQIVKSMTLCGSWMNENPFKNEEVLLSKIHLYSFYIESFVAIEAKSRRDDSEYEQS